MKGPEVVALVFVVSIGVAVLFGIRRHGWQWPPPPVRQSAAPNLAWLPLACSMVLLGLLAAVSNDDPLGRLAGVLGTVGGVAMLLTGAVGHRRAVADAQRSTSLQEIDEPLWDSRSAGQ